MTHPSTSSHAIKRRGFSIQDDPALEPNLEFLIPLMGFIDHIIHDLQSSLQPLANPDSIAIVVIIRSHTLSDGVGIMVYRGVNFLAKFVNETHPTTPLSISNNIHVLKPFPNTPDNNWRPSSPPTTTRCTASHLLRFFAGAFFLPDGGAFLAAGTGMGGGIAGGRELPIGGMDTGTGGTERELLGIMGFLRGLKSGLQESLATRFGDKAAASLATFAHVGSQTFPRLALHATCG